MWNPLNVKMKSGKPFNSIVGHHHCASFIQYENIKINLLIN